ncbi:arginine exporter protein [compost metagenome]
MLSLLNPHAILDTIGVIGTSSMSYEGERKLAFTTACIIISWFWFVALALAGKLIGSQDKSGAVLKHLNKVSAIVMWAAAGYLVYSI